MAADLIDEGRISLVVIATLTEVVERADVFAAQTLDDDDNHIAWNKGRGVGRIVLGGEDGIEFFLCSEISGIDERLLAQRANDREGRVEHDGGIGWTTDVLIGVGDGNGSHGCGEASAHTGHGESNHDEQSRSEGGVVVAETNRLGFILFAAGQDVQFIHCPNEYDEQQDKIPTVQNLGAHDVSQIAFVGEFAKDSGCGATSREREIDRIGKIGNDADAIEYQIDDAYHAMIACMLLQVDGQEHQ